MAKEENPLALMQELEASKGWKVMQKIQLLKTTSNIFAGNHVELKKLLDAYQHPELALKISSVGNEEKLGAFLQEVGRHLHNYLAAAATLVEHTRILATDLYAETEFWKEYDGRVEQLFRSSPLHHFVIDLRNYFLHKALPMTAATTEFGRDIPFETSITIDVNGLRDWDGWSSQSRQYLAGLGKTARLHEIVDAYASIVVGFYQWFGQRQSEIHHDELEQTTALLEKLRV